LPLLAGGGIRNLRDIESLLSLGVNRVALSNITPRNLGFLAEAAAKFGSERIITAIDGIKNPPESGLHRLEAVMPNTDTEHGFELVNWVKQIEKQGTSAILLTSRDTDGTKNGYDLEMTKAVAQAVSIPVIASGGAGSMEDIYAVITGGKAQAVLAASVFHSGMINIMELKKYLYSRGIPVNMPPPK